MNTDVVNNEDNDNYILQPDIVLYTNIPQDFSPILYKQFNLDLQYMSDIEAMMHYNTTGYFENRVYKHDTNYKFYIYCCGKSGGSTLYTS